MSKINFFGAERGIWTLGAFAGTPVFETGTFDHSDISALIWEFNKLSRISFHKKLLNYLNALILSHKNF